MLYLDHFGLKEAPFALTPDPEFFFDTTEHRQALNVLLVALHGGEGFLKITGEVGTGKTLLCRKLLSSLGEDFASAYLPNPLLGPVELHRAIAQEIGAGRTAPESTLHELQQQILDRSLDLHSQGKRIAVCIDEAQAMSDVSLEALRLLSNLETTKRKLLQIVLFAQPELDLRLEQETLRQLRQRISFAYHLTPLDRAGVNGYIDHRLLVSGRSGGGLFRAAAKDEIFRASKGVPRLVNILAHKALLAAYGQKAGEVDLQHVRLAARDTTEAQQPFRRRFSPALLISLVLIVLIEVVVVVLLVTRSS